MTRAPLAAWPARTLGRRHRVRDNCHAGGTTSWTGTQIRADPRASLPLRATRFPRFDGPLWWASRKSAETTDFQIAVAFFAAKEILARFGWLRQELDIGCCAGRCILVAGENRRGSVSVGYGELARGLTGWATNDCETNFFSICRDSQRPPL